MSNSCKFYRSGGLCISTENGRCGYMNNEEECVEMVLITHNETKEEKTIFEEASDIINGERQDSYGKPEDSFQIIAEFWNTYIVHKHEHDVTLNAKDIAIMMSLFKHARMLGQKESRDNYIDAAGYLAIAADRL